MSSPNEWIPETSEDDLPEPPSYQEWINQMSNPFPPLEEDIIPNPPVQNQYMARSVDQSSNFGENPSSSGRESQEPDQLGSVNWGYQEYSQDGSRSQPIRSQHRREFQSPYKRPEGRRRGSQGTSSQDYGSELGPQVADQGSHGYEDYQYGQSNQPSSSNQIEDYQFRRPNQPSSSTQPESSIQNTSCDQQCSSKDASEFLDQTDLEVQAILENSGELWEEEAGVSREDESEEGQPRTHFTRKQTTVLKKQFEQNPNAESISKIATIFGVTEFVIQSYFSYLRLEKKKKERAKKKLESDRDPKSRERGYFTCEQEDMMKERLPKGPLDLYEAHYYADLFNQQNERGSKHFVDDMHIKRWFKSPLRRL